MFYVGQKVRCVNGRFHPSVVDWAENIPVAGEIYTVRYAGFGTHPITHHSEGYVVLVELPNPPAGNGKEVFFAASRFIPLELEDTTSIASENEHGEILVAAYSYSAEGSDSNFYAKA